MNITNYWHQSNDDSDNSDDSDDSVEEENTYCPECGNIMFEDIYGNLLCSRCDDFDDAS